jgi:hypothetical protein
MMSLKNQSALSDTYPALAGLAEELRTAVNVDIEFPDLELLGRDAIFIRYGA